MDSQHPDVAAQLETLAAQLNAVAQNLRSSNTSLTSNPAERMKLLKLINNFASTVKEPQDDIMETMISSAKLAATNLFLKWDVFEMIPVDGTISYSELAKNTGADVNLITRVAWMLGATDVLKQIGTDHVAHTKMSRLFASTNPISALMRMGMDDHIPAFSAMPKYFETYGLKEPVGRYHTVFAYSMGAPEETVWQVMNRDPARMKNFMVSMAAMEHTWPVLGTYDLSWALSQAEKSPHRPLVVDVGGGKGHCLKDIVKATPGLPMERCVLEDLPEVLGEVQKLEDPALRGARLVTVDFHKEQPVKGALVYYIRRCLHDYGDEDSIDMLRHISDAMVEDSRLLIVEQILSNPPSATGSAADIFMATIGGKERTIENFTEIAEKAGLKIKQVFSNPGTDAGLIECVKV